VTNKTTKYHYPFVSSVLQLSYIPILETSVQVVSCSG